MVLPNSEVASLKSALRCWEWFGYVSTAIVGLGCIGEFVAEFTSLPRNENVASKLARLSLIVLILGIAGELLSAVRTSEISGQIIADIEERAAKAEQDAGEANERASADERMAAQLRKDAEGLHKEAESERLARIELQKLVAWRTINTTERDEIARRLKKYSGVRIAFTINAGDPEGFSFGTQMASVAIRAGWSVVAFAPILNLGQFRTGVHITTTGDKLTRDATDALIKELNRLHFDAVRSPEIDAREQPLMYVFVELRPQAIPNEISNAINKKPR